MSKRKLAAYVHVDGTVYGPGDDVPADVAKQITNPKAWGEGSDDDGDGDDGPSYKSMKVDELKAEIDQRNTDRDDDAKLSTEGNKADLVKVLTDDDASASA
jgi:hypothetical protein